MTNNRVNGPRVSLNLTKQISIFTIVNSYATIGKPHDKFIIFLTIHTFDRIYICLFQRGVLALKDHRGVVF